MLRWEPDSSPIGSPQSPGSSRLTTAHAQAIREAIERLDGRGGRAEDVAGVRGKVSATEAGERSRTSLERSVAIADTKAVAKVRDPALRTLFARIGGVEAMHWALLRSTLGEPPIPESLPPVE
jgi:ferritin-like protein